jgi:cephalosporin hydroxylase
MNDLEEFAKKHGTDKQMSCHGYTKFYNKQFNHLRDKPLKILEIGVHMGYSLKMWADYFPLATIWGIDNGSSGDLCETYENPQIQFRKGSQDDGEFLTRVANEAGQFDIILDDGSHYSQHIVYSMNYLFGPYLKKGGYYVVEDLHCSFPPFTSPGLAARFNSENKTAVQYISDIINVVHIDSSKEIEEIVVNHQMTFLKKKD